MPVAPKPIFALVLILALAGCSKPAADDGGQVFGVKMGVALTTLNSVAPLAEPPLVNYAFQPAATDPDFTDYAVLAAPAAGICVVRARGPAMTPAVLDARLKDLRGKYGKESFNAGLGSYYWYPSAQYPALSPSIQTVALSPLETGTSLTITFRNILACRKELGIDAP